MRARGLAPRTATLYAREIRNAEAFFAKQGYTLKDVPGSVVEEYAESKPRTYSSRKLVHYALRYAWEIERRRNPPTWSVWVPRQPEMVCRAVEEADATELDEAAYDCATNPVDTAEGRLRQKQALAVLLGLYVGMRREELARARRADFTDEGWVRIVGKGGRFRELPLHQRVLDALAAYPEPGPWLFPGRFGGHVTPTTVWTWIKNFNKQVGVRGLTTHVLRHTCLATINDNTGDLRATQDYAGHSKPETTAGYTRTKRQRLVVCMRAVRYERPVNQLEKVS